MTSDRAIRGLSASLLLTAAIASSSSHAETGTIVMRIDPQHSHAEFELRALAMLGVHGRFGEVSGSLRLDPINGTGMVDARIETGTVQMDSSEREEWARSAEFFDSTRHPVIYFFSDPMPQSRLHHGGALAGTLILRGIKRQIALKLSPASCDRPGLDCAITARSSISRGAFGMRSKRGLLGDRVQLTLTVRVSPAPPPAPSDH